ncbi:hypothetical protein GE061_004322 [Apolygus lucorum]|uniref:Uncharacterized protein n=1 Tax=Apolygus lucorum TaxID=248454 RepID=A0A6A4J4W3_APOLU|nr:hypothetical protein GE061_004322 [Apolygus lucorum]
MLGMCRPAGISLILVLVAYQQSASGESGHEWTKKQLGSVFDPNVKSSGTIYLKDMPKEERKKFLGYFDRAMKLHDESFHSNRKKGTPQYEFVKLVYNNKNVMADTYKRRYKDIDLLSQVSGSENKQFIFKDDKFVCVLMFYVHDGAVGIVQPVTGICMPVNVSH